MKTTMFFINFLKKIYLKSIKQFKRRQKKNTITNTDPYKSQLYEKFVHYFDQEANDHVRNILLSGKPCMISKFGTTELGSLINYLSIQQKKYSISDIFNYITGKRQFLWLNVMLNQLCSLSGFFPFDESLFNKFCRLYIQDMQEIDVLGSYIRNEKVFDNELKSALRINLDGYYAPFYFSNPWTTVLEGKKVLVVHPFNESIEYQYARKDKIWNNPQILPDFKLITIKAVQTIAGEKSEYKNWFDALDTMKMKISNTDFDIALIGCGAYGMPLAAHVKRMGKQAVHLAGWLQVLFGIKGKRWIDNPRVASYINDFWVNPLQSETPKEYKKVENGAYW